MSARRLGTAILAVCVAVGLATPARAATTWTVVASPNIGSIANELYGTTALSTTSAWAAGSWYDNSKAAPRTLTLRWNGTTWATVSSPNATNYYNELRGVDATSANSAWAVGYANGSSGVNGTPRNTLALRWNGTSWAVVTTPNPGVSNRELYAVDAITATDVWAAGWYYDTGFAAETLMLHYNGTSWTQVPSPSPGTSVNQLYGVSGTSASDVWAVGTYASSGEPRNIRHPLALHYNGTAWQWVAIPGNAYLRAVKAISPTDAWAVGSKNGYATPVAYHWDGTAWTEVPTPSVGTTGNNLFYGVTALGATQVWAVGYTSGSGPQPLVERWNGTSWSVESLPTLPAGGLLAGATSVTGTVWGVGTRSDYVNGNLTDRTLTMRGTGT